MTIATAASNANRRVSCVVRFLLLSESIDASPFSFDGNDHAVGYTDDLVARAPGRNGMHADLVRAGRLCDSDGALAISDDHERSQYTRYVQRLDIARRQIHTRDDLAVHLDNRQGTRCTVHDDPEDNDKCHGGEDDHGRDSVTPLHSAAVGTKVIGPSVDSVPVASTMTIPTVP